MAGRCAECDEPTGSEYKDPAAFLRKQAAALKPPTERTCETCADKDEVVCDGMFRPDKQCKAWRPKGLSGKRTCATCAGYDYGSSCGWIKRVIENGCNIWRPKEPGAVAPQDCTCSKSLFPDVGLSCICSALSEQAKVQADKLTNQTAARHLKGAHDEKLRRPRP